MNIAYFLFYTSVIEDRICLGQDLSFIKIRLNSSFRQLTFTKLRLWSPKKKTIKPSLKFCNCSSFDPQSKK